MGSDLEQSFNESLTQFDILGEKESKAIVELREHLNQAKTNMDGVQGFEV